jgi:hypothetical protein
VWIDTNGGTCTRSATPVAYSDARACASLDAAWDTLAAGEVARIVAGTYGSQKVTGAKTADTYLVGAGNGAVNIQGNMECLAEFGGDGAFCALGAHMVLEHVRITATQPGMRSAAGIDAPDVEFHDVDIWGNFPALTVADANFRWIGGNHGQPNVTPPPVTCSMSTGQPTTVAGPNTVFDGITFWKKIAQGGPGPYCGSDNYPHIENIRVESNSNGFTLLNSRFVAGSDAGSGHVFQNGGTNSTGFRFEGNIFEPVNGSYAMQMYGNVSSTSWVFRNNRFDQRVIITSGTPITCGNSGQVPASWAVSC